MNNATLLSVNVPSTNISDKIIQFRPMCRFATHWPNAFDESLAECIDLRRIIGRMHSANLFFGPMCLLRGVRAWAHSSLRRTLFVRTLFVAPILGCVALYAISFDFDWWQRQSWWIYLKPFPLKAWTIRVRVLLDFCCLHLLEYELEPPLNWIPLSFFGLVPS